MWWRKWWHFGLGFLLLRLRGRFDTLIGGLCQRLLRSLLLRAMLWRRLSLLFYCRLLLFVIKYEEGTGIAGVPAAAAAVLG